MRWKKSIDFLILIGIACKVRCYFFFEELKVRVYFYPHLFYRHDQMLKKLNPYHIAKAFLQKKGEADVDTYGETPLTSLYKIAKQCDLTPLDRVVDLGCGRGRGVFFLRDIIGCHTTGIDWVPEFIAHAQHIQSIENDLGMEWICQDITQADLSKATWIYLCGTCFSDCLIEQLIALFSTLPCDTKIITISYSLQEYSSLFRVVKQFSVRFPWGKGDVYLNQKRRLQ